MSRVTKELPLLYLEWLDAGVVTQGDWLTREDVLQESRPEKFLNQTTGWVLHEDADTLVITSQIAKDHEAPRYDLVMMIPKALIRKRKTLKV